MTDEPKRRSLSEAPEGRYANHFRIGYNDVELIIDCYQSYGEDEQSILHTRIITSPSYGKALLNTLRDTLDEFEKCYGCIAE